MQTKAPFAKFIKFYWKIMFYSENPTLTVLYCLFEFSKRLEFGLTLFEECMQKLQRK
jgi:hypothetical protein